MRLPKVESVKQDRYARAQRQGNRNVYYGRLILLDEPVRAIFEKKSIDLANVQHYPFPKGDCVVYTDQMKNALEASGQVKLREVREFWNSRKLHRADIHVFTGGHQGTINNKWQQ
ncbi:hypothetical protein IPH67_00050 [bacterium]|nr:MAG: hypothetical protein IPH67_00050 [bacterium]